MNVVPEAQHAITNSHCSLKLEVWGALNLLVGPRQSPGGGSGGKPVRSRDPTIYISQKMPKIHPRGPFTLNYNFMNFVD